jgi:transposase
MMAMLDTGMSLRRVAREFNTTHTTALRVKQRWLAISTHKNKPRKGRPERLIRVKKRYIMRLAKKDRQITYEVLCDTAPMCISRRTMRRLFRTNYGCKWKVLYRPKTTKETAKLRLDLSRTWVNRVEELKEIRELEVQHPI